MYRIPIDSALFAISINSREPGRREVIASAGATVLRGLTTHEPVERGNIGDMRFIANRPMLPLERAALPVEFLQQPRAGPADIALVCLESSPEIQDRRRGGLAMIRL